MSTSPHIKPRLNSVRMVMLDVVIALLPLVFAAWLAYGNVVLVQIGTAVAAAFLTEFTFSALLLKKRGTLLDGSALVTALLMTFTLSPLTPLHVTAFGAFSAILFGKILCGGLGKNRFNPALVGREFAGVFFASVMTSPDLWKTGDLVETRAVDLFPGLAVPEWSGYLSSLVFKTSGAMGEYSIVAIAAGGLYLLLRNRISWHIPLALLGTFTLLEWTGGGERFHFSLAAILLGTIFMATDMPSSPTTPNGKLYYGAMTAVVIFLLIKGGVRHEYLSYGILLMNAFSEQVSSVFRPRPWGVATDWPALAENAFLLTVKIVITAFAVMAIHSQGLMVLLLAAYLVHATGLFVLSPGKRLNQPI